MIKAQHQKWLHCHRYLLMADGGVATAQLDLSYDPAKPLRDGFTALFWSLWVDEDHRRQGYAKALLAHAEQLAKNEGHCKLALEWDEREAEQYALDFYVRSGFSERLIGRYGSLLEKELP